MGKLTIKILDMENYFDINFYPQKIYYSASYDYSVGFFGIGMSTIKNLKRYRFSKWQE
jgi:hypothetical protein